MAKKNSLLTWLVYIAARAASGVLLVADIQTSLLWAKKVAGLFYPLFKGHANRTRQHIALAFPHFTPEQIERTTQKAFEHLAMVGLEILHTPRALHPNSLSKYVDTSGLSAETLSLFNEKKPAVLVTGHIGSWEILGYSLAVLGYPMHAIARPLDNALINQWIFGMRQKRGLRLLNKTNSAHQARRLLNEGELVGFIADQNAGPKGHFVPFMGRLASAHKSVALLAINANVPVVCGAAIRLPKADQLFHYCLQTTDIIYPQDWANQEDPAFYITARWAHAVERSIEAHPDQYLWMHRRWRSRPQFEENNQPMPADLRLKLEALPWMTPEKLSRLLLR